ncbi:MAG: GNAT family N-acetyltransferase [Bacilli bacterium]|nr:GNAT family N-acetyltransferase [Bacilli bacterium]
MRKIVAPTENDIPAIGKLFGRAELDMEYNALQDESLENFKSRSLEAIIESKSSFVEKEGATVLGFIEITHFYKDLFLGEEAKQSEGFALLDSFGYKGENVIAFPTFFIDPKWMGKGVAREFFQGVMSRYEETSFLVQVDIRNKRAIRFLEKLGYYDFGPHMLKSKSSTFMVKPYIPQGLCRKAFW